MISAKIIADSISNNGKRLTTLELSYPRCILSEVNTHRAFSKSSMSSRAIPVAKMIEQVRTKPFVPHVWGMNQAGMQSSEVADADTQWSAEGIWMAAGEMAARAAESLAKLGLHKQIVNRLLEPFQWTRTILTGTEFHNFFELRDHPAAEPHFQLLAKAMRVAMDESSPILRWANAPHLPESWHLPYISDAELDDESVLQLAKISAARCARVSYLNHDGSAPSMEADLALYARLAGGVPIHASPLEHQACPAKKPQMSSGNFYGWHQFRQLIEENPHA